MHCRIPVSLMNENRSNTVNNNVVDFQNYVSSKSQAERLINRKNDGFVIEDRQINGFDYQELPSSYAGNEHMFDSLNAEMIEAGAVREFLANHNLSDALEQVLNALSERLPSIKPTVYLDYTFDDTGNLVVSVPITDSHTPTKQKKAYDSFLRDWLVNAEFFGDQPIIVRWV